MPAGLQISTGGQTFRNLQFRRRCLLTKTTPTYNPGPFRLKIRNNPGKRISDQQVVLTTSVQSLVSSTENLVMPTPTRRKDDVIQIRASAEAKAILNRAAALRGQKLSEFMLESARRQAEETILDQRTFFLDDDAHARFIELSIQRPRHPPKPAPDCVEMPWRITAASPQLRAPELLAARHDVSRFANGIHGSLDQWLRERWRAKGFPRGHTWFARRKNRIASSAIFRLPRPSNSATRFLQRTPARHARANTALVDWPPCRRCGMARQGLDGALRGRIETVPWSIRDRRSAWHCRPRYRRSRHRFLRAPRFRSFPPRRTRHADADRNGSVPGRPKHQGNQVKKSCGDEPCKEVVVPSGNFALEA